MSGVSVSASALTLTCPRCDLSVVARQPSLAPRHCPRCLARRRIAVRLESTASVSAIGTAASAANAVSPGPSRSA